MAGARRCVVPVHVHGDDGTVTVYSAGDEIPAEHVALISNPNVWGVDDVEAPPAAGPVAPPRAGKGSGLDAWVAYAEALGLDVDPDATRDDIIAAVDDLS